MTNAKSKTAVVLFSLGGPDRPESIAPFLKNFFMDPAIIRAPLLVRWLLSRWIAFSRSRGPAGASYGALGGRSPLLDNTRAQAQALQKKLGDAYRVFVCMRYWHPMAQQVVQDVADYAPEEVILLGLYPQFSTTTTDSAFKDWQRATDQAGFTAPTKKICCWAQEPGFIAASSRLVRAAVDEARNKLSRRPVRLLFSAHGLPEKIIAAGDPYQAQCEATASAILAAMGGYEDSILCYQSRVGPLRWIGPSTEEEIRRAGRDGVGVVIYPLAFVSEHVETLVELDIEYRHLAQQSGVPVYVRAPTVMTQPEFIEGLSRLVIQAQTDSRETCGPGSCGPSYSACPCSKREAA